MLVVFYNNKKMLIDSINNQIKMWVMQELYSINLTLKNCAKGAKITKVQLYKVI